MSDKINEAIQDIAVKHGVILGKDDPVLILQTMNDRLLEENRKAQQAMLTQFKEEMESISAQWKDDAREKAEKVLNAALIGSKQAMNKIMKKSASESVQAMQKMILDSLAEAHELAEHSRKFSMCAMVCSAIMINGAFLFTLISLM